MGARWSLDDVRALLATDDPATLRLSATLIRGFSSRRVAEATVRAIFEALTPGHYSTTLTQQFNEQFDVYGIVYEEKPYYFKFLIEVETTVVVVSCHEPKWPLQTLKGMVKP